MSTAVQEITADTARPNVVLTFTDDLVADPAEQHNVAMAHPEVVKRLKVIFARTDTEMPMPP